MTSMPQDAVHPGPTAQDVLRDQDLSGRRALVTGATSGIGLATATALLGAGAEIVITARDSTSGARAAAAIALSGDPSEVAVLVLDLADLDSVHHALAGWSGPLDVLVANAGIMAVPDRRLSPQGHELQLATNHLGHFALATGLESALSASGAARVVSVSSGAHRRSPVVFDDIDFTDRDYDPWSAYGQSKTANILFAVGAAARWATSGIAVNACAPGSVITNLGRFVGEVNSAPPGELKTVDQGAATSVLLATVPSGTTGRYFVDEVPAEASPFATDKRFADQLWEVSTRMVAERR